MLSEQHIKTVILTNPFDSSDREELSLVYQGESIADLLKDVKTETAVAVNGRIIQSHEYEKTVPLGGDTLVIGIAPGGGDSGGGTGKMILRMVAVVALTYFTMGAGAAVIGLKAGSAVAIGAYIGGTLLINKLIPPVSPKAPDQSLGASPSQTYGLDGPKNTSREGIPYPIVFGKYRMAGNIINTRTLNRGSKQTLYMLMNAGEGEIAGISDVEINDEPAENYDTEVTTRLGKLNQDPIPDFLDASSDRYINYTLVDREDSYTMTIDQAASGFEVDIKFQSGLGAVSNTDGSNITRRVSALMLYQPVNGRKHMWKAVHETNTKQGAGGPDIDDLIRGYDYYEQDRAIAIPFSPGSDVDMSDYEKILFKHSFSESETIRNDASGNDFMVEPGGKWQSNQYDQPTNHYYQIFGVRPDGTEESLGGSNFMSENRFEAKGLRTFSGAYNEQSQFTIKSDELPLGRYRVLVERITPEHDNNAQDREMTVNDAMSIMTLREYRGVEGIGYVNTALIGIKTELDNKLSNLPKVTYLNHGMLIETFKRNAANPSQFDMTMKASNNPAWIVYAMYTNKRWGAKLDKDRIMFEEFYAWAQVCEQNGWLFNGVFDSRMNIFEAARAVAKVGHGVITPSGTRIGINIYAKKQMTQMFTEATIEEGSLTLNWLPLKERANVIDCTYYDKDNKYLPRTFRYYNDSLLASKHRFRPTDMNLFGVDNYEQAVKECIFALNMNQLSMNASFSTDVQAIACRVGDVVGIQHSMPAWGVGGLVSKGSTTSVVKLDRPVTMEAGKEYSILLHYDSVQVDYLSGCSIQSGDLRTLRLTSKPDANANRVVFNSEEFDIEAIDYDEVDSQWIAILDRDAKGTRTAPARFYQTDASVTRKVTTVAGSNTALAVTTNLPAAPSQHMQFSFGENEKQVKKILVSEISGEGVEKRTISGLEYYDSVYDEELVTDLPNFSSFPTPDYTVSEVVGDEVVYGNAVDKKRKLVMRWAYHDSNATQQANVYVRFTSNDYVLVSKQAATSAEINMSDPSVDITRLYIKIVPLNDRGIEVKPRQQPEYVYVTGQDLSIPPPQSLIGSIDRDSVTLYWRKGNSLNFPDGSWRYDVYKAFVTAGNSAPSFPADFTLYDNTMEQFHRFDKLPANSDCYFAVVSVNPLNPKEFSPPSQFDITTPVKYSNRTALNGMEIWYSNSSVNASGLGNPDTEPSRWSREFSSTRKTQAILTWSGGVFQPWAITAIEPEFNGLKYLGELSTYPANPKEGDLFLHTTDQKYYIRRGSVWEDFMQRNINGLKAEYSPNGVQDEASSDYNWSETFRVGFDRFMRQSVDGGNSWSESALFVGERGEDGRFKDYRFRRSSLNSPGIDKSNPDPTNWFDAPPSGTDNLFFIVAEKNPDGSFYNGAKWSDPVRLNGQDGEDGKDGKDGINAEIYKIGYPKGLAIKNGENSIDLTVRHVTGSSDSVITGNSDPQLYDSNGNAKGRALTLDRNDINGHRVYTLKSGGKVLDSVTVLDVADGENAVVGGASHDNTLSWVKDKNDGNWSPSNDETFYTVRFYRKGNEIAKAVIEADLHIYNAEINIRTVEKTGEATAVSVLRNDSAAPTVTVEHTASGAKVIETFNAVRGGDKGDKGEDAITFELDKAAIVVAADQEGNVFEGLPQTIYSRLIKAGVEDTSNWNITVDASSGISGSKSGSSYTVTGMTSDAGQITFTASQNGQSNRTATVSLSKTKEGRPGQTFGDIISPPSYKWFFSASNGSPMGWNYNNCAMDVNSTERVMKLFNASGSPIVHKSGMNFSSSKNYLVAIRLRCTSKTLRKFRIFCYYHHNTGTGFVSEKKEYLDVNLPEDKWTNLIFDMRRVSLWQDGSNIKGLRFDLKAQEDFEIDVIRVGYFGVGDDDPNIANSNVDANHVGLGSVPNWSGSRFRQEADDRVVYMRPDSLYANAGVDKAHVGLGSVPNWSESRFRQEADDRANGRIGVLRPEGSYKNSFVDKAHVGLGSVPNWSESRFRQEADDRVYYRRPDSSYKNDRVDKAHVGLSRVPNWYASQFDSSAVSAALAEALLKNPDGEGINFLNPMYFDPMVGIPLTSTRLSGSEVDETMPVDIDVPGNLRGCYRFNTTGDDAYMYLGSSSTDYNMQLQRSRKWLVSFYVYRYSSEASGGLPNYGCYIKTSDGSHHGAQYGVHTNYRAWRRISMVVDCTDSTSTHGILRIDVDKTNNGIFYVAGIMVERYLGNSTDPSPLVTPIGKQYVRNAQGLPTSNVFGAGAVLGQSSPAFSSTADGSGAQINVSAHRMYYGDGSVYYGSGDIRSLSRGLTYYVYSEDPYYQGKNSYQATTTSRYIVGNNSRRYLGKIKTYSGSGTTSPPGEYCAHVDTWLTPTLQLKDAKVGDIIDGVTKGIPGKSAIQQIEFSESECVRLTTKSGATKIVSFETPIDRKDGTTFMAVNAMNGDGEDFLVNIDGEVYWEEVVKVEDLGVQPIAKMNCGDISYFGGETPERRICTHNIQYKP